MLGSIPIFALWMANLAVLFGLFSRYYRISAFRSSRALIVLLVGFEVFGLTDNHRFRYKQAEIQRPSSRRPLHVLARLAQGHQAYRNAGKPYPSTSWRRRAAGSMRPTRRRSFSARMQDCVANFAQHVFAVSSVSGGSLARPCSPA